MKGYVINLDRSHDRWEIFQRRAAEAGLVFERFAAFDGAALDEELYALWGGLTRRWGPLTKTELATFLSHRGVWQKVAEGEDRWAFVVEDDVIFTKDSANVLSSVSWLPGDVHLIKVETMFTRVELSADVIGQKGAYKLRYLKNNHNGAAGYILTRESARLLLSWSQGRCEPVDRLMFHPSQIASSGFMIAQLTPALCAQDFHLLDEHELKVATSTIGPIRNRRGVLPHSRRLRTRLWRLIVRSIRDIRRFGVRVLGISVFERVGMPSLSPGCGLRRNKL